MIVHDQCHMLNANASVWDWPAKANTKSTFVENQYTCQNMCQENERTRRRLARERKR